MRALCCPQCGAALFVIGEGALGELPPARATEAAQGEDSTLPATSFREGKWRIECPEHEWHAANFWPAKKGMPAVVKCTAFVDEAKGEYCNTKVPADVAKRRAGLAP